MQPVFSYPRHASYTGTPSYSHSPYSLNSPSDTTTSMTARLGAATLQSPVAINTGNSSVDITTPGSPAQSAAAQGGVHVRLPSNLPFPQSLPVVGIHGLLASSNRRQSSERAWQPETGFVATGSHNKASEKEQVVSGTIPPPLALEPRTASAPMSRQVQEPQVVEEEEVQEQEQVKPPQRLPTPQIKSPEQETAATAAHDSSAASSGSMPTRKIYRIVRLYGDREGSYNSNSTTSASNNASTSVRPWMTSSSSSTPSAPEVEQSPEGDYSRITWNRRSSNDLARLQPTVVVPRVSVDDVSSAANALSSMHTGSQTSTPTHATSTMSNALAALPPSFPSALATASSTLR